VRHRPGHLGWLVIAACGGAAPAPPSTSTPAAPVAPAGPAPAAQWTGSDVATSGLPAVASDGSAVVIAHRDNDGGRGNPNLTLIEKDRSDREVSRLVVLTPSDIDHEGAAQIAARFVRAAAWLRERHEARRLVAMTALARSDELPGAARGPGITLRWVPGQLVLEREGRPPVIRPTPASWLAPDRAMCHGCTERCENEAFLAGGHVDPERAIALIVISYRGTDICWEPSSQHHVVAW
jgi:hypothetical protein